MVGSEAGVDVGGLISGNGDKPIVFYTKAPAQAWKFWEYKVGVKANIGNGGFALGYGLLESSTTIDWGGFSIELFGGVDRIGYTVAYDTDFKQGSVGTYATKFVRPWPILVYGLLYMASGGAVGVPQFA